MIFLIERQLTVVFIYFVNQISGQFVNEIDCGIKRTGIQYFIVGGTDAHANEFLFMASLQMNNKHFCGATILNSRWVLTVAHCVPTALDESGKPTDIHIVVGSVDIYDQSKAFAHNVSKRIINGCFKKTRNADQMVGDIALLMTKEDFDLSEKNIGTVCLPPKESDPIDSDIEVIGWGVTTETGSSEIDETASRILQKTTGKLISEEYCLFALYFRNIGLLNIKSGKRICFHSKNTTVCRGDSGGPALQIIDGRVYQFGVASFISVTFPFNVCSKGNPVFYTKVFHYIDWISNSIEKYENSKETVIETDCDQ